jgi:hypothetical protein
VYTFTGIESSNLSLSASPCRLWAARLKMTRAPNGIGFFGYFLTFLIVEDDTFVVVFAFVHLSLCG